MQTTYKRSRCIGLGLFASLCTAEAHGYTWPPPTCISIPIVKIEINNGITSELITRTQRKLIEWYFRSNPKKRPESHELTILQTIDHRLDSAMSDSTTVLIVDKPPCDAKCRGTAIFLGPDHHHHQVDFVNGPYLASEVEFDGVGFDDDQGFYKTQQKFIRGPLRVFLTPDERSFLTIADVWEQTRPNQQPPHIPIYTELSVFDVKMANQKLQRPDAFYLNCIHGKH
jgi:hypothetical protein